MTAILVKIVAAALKQHPTLNAAVDMVNHEIVYRESINIGVAVDTERGLLVPVIRDADRMNLTELGVTFDDLAGRARNKKLKPDEMQGGTFSISNLGGIGGTGFSPIVNWPEVAILGVSRGTHRAPVARRLLPPSTHAPAVPVLRPPSGRRRRRSAISSRGSKELAGTAVAVGA